MISRNPQDYFIVTKHVTLHIDGQGNGDPIIEALADEPQGLQKTFYLISKDGYKQRYSTESAPKWVKKVYEIHTGTKLED
jgi:hypothetical protein